MIWQDAVFATGTLFMAISTLPIIFNKDSKVPRSASLIRSTVYTVFTYTYISLSFYWSAALMFLDLLCWLFIAWKRV